MAKPIYAIVGPDSFLQLQQLQAIVSQLPKDTQRSDYDGETAAVSEVLDELRCFAMFGGAKLVVVRNGDAFLSRFREPLEKYATDPSMGNTMVIRLLSLPGTQKFAKFVAKTGSIIQCKPPVGKELVLWIQDHGKNAHKLLVPADAAAALADQIGNDLGKLDTELAKLALRVADGAKVTPADVLAGASFQREQEMWVMTDALAAGKTAEALKRWRQLMQTDPSAEFRAATWLTMWLESVRKALALLRDGDSPAAIASKLRVWPAERAGSVVASARALGEEGLERTITELAEMDRNSKTGVGEAAANVERFILTVNLPR